MSDAPVPVSVQCAVRLGTFTLDVDFTAAPGLTVLFGPSGAGKTTILNLIAGLQRPDRGRITLGSDVVVETARNVFVPPHRRRIGLVFQDAQLFPHLTVRQNIAFGRWFAGRAAPCLPLDQVVGILAIGDLLDRRPARLSGGEKQRVSLARALLCAPRLLLMDEPLGGLDDVRRSEILPLIERLRDEVAIPILYVTHDRDEALRLASHAIALDRGRVQAAGTPGKVLRRSGAG